MSEGSAEEPKGVALQILRGGTAPPELGSDLTKLLTLPEAAQKEFWTVLAAYLQPVFDEAAQRTVVAFCERHDLSTEAIAPAIKGARYLFQETAKQGSGLDALRADIAALVDEDDATELVPLLVPWLEDFLPKLRTNLARQAIADHGKVVIDSQWRVDRIGSSSRGKDLDTSVAVITFTYQEGERTERVTLHLLPDQVSALRQHADEMLA